MKMSKSIHNKLLLGATIIGAGMFSLSCQKKLAGKRGSSSLASLNTTVKGEIAEGSDPARLCSYIKDKGYFPSNSYAANTKVLFSSSYEVVDNSAGQGYGVIGSDGYFEQQGNTTTQLLLCPGAPKNGQGRCLWKFNGSDGYAQLAYDVVCNKRSRNGGQVHPGYTRQSAKLVSYVGNTAGQSVSGGDAVEVVMEGRDSKARIVFAKGTGLVATLFQESLQPAGTSEVFIGAGGSFSGGGDNQGSQNNGFGSGQNGSQNGSQNGNSGGSQNNGSGSGPDSGSGQDFESDGNADSNYLKMK